MSLSTQIIDTHSLSLLFITVFFSYRKNIVLRLVCARKDEDLWFEEIKDERIDLEVSKIGICHL